MQLVIAEKPSVARDLARVLGVRPSGRTSFEGNGKVITWCIGHLVELDEPASYDGRWQSWRMDTLPMLPGEFKLRGVPSTADQLRAVCALLRDERFREVVNACDAGREGELIFRYVYQLAGSAMPIRRLWISSLTDEAIRQGFAALRPGRDLESLADAARCRSEADWLVGLNATRAVTLRHRTGQGSTLFSIGRVQTPTLAILVDRERQLRAFVPQDYWLLKANLAMADGAGFQATFTAGKSTRFASAAVADAVAERDRERGAIDRPDGPVVESIKQSKSREPPPLLFDLTSLQRTANKRFGLSAKATLDAAQGLYERHKLLTYPRTDSRHLSADMVGEMQRIVGGVAKITDYAEHARPLLGMALASGKRIFDDTKVSDHHAIIPTGKSLDPSALSRDEQRIFDLVVRRFLGVFYPDAEFAQTEAVIRVGSAEQSELGRAQLVTDEAGAIIDVPAMPDRYVARGRVRLVAGWQAVAGFGEDEEKSAKGRGGKGKKDDEDEDTPASSLPPLTQGQHLAGTFATVAKKTKPPTRHTEASLLSAMENAGKLVEDEELRLAMKDSGLGTPATRAAIIETLLKRGYVVRDGKHLVPTPMGIALLDALPVQTLASPELTGQWEARLARIARGEEARATFMADIATYVRDMVVAIRSSQISMPAFSTVADPPSPPARRKTQKPKSASGAAPVASRRSRANRSDHPKPNVPSTTSPVEVPEISDLSCPSCKKGHLIRGKRGWGCSEWRDGCRFVVWFEEDGKKRNEADLRRIVRAASAARA